MAQDDEHRMSDDALRRASLVLRLRSMGITDHRLVSVFESTRRDAFAPEAYRADAYADRLIPIACGQTMEAPSVCAQLLRAVPVAQHMSVLEIGTGSGYLTALLARLSRRVISVERYRSLVNLARRALEGERITNVDVVLSDGTAGWPAAGPYQAIFVTASAPAPAQAWLEQLSAGGALIMPVGAAASGQSWVRFTKDDEGNLDQEVVGPAFSTPLEPGLARAL